MKAVKQALIAAAVAFVVVATFQLGGSFAIFGGAVTGAAAVAVVTFTSTFLTSGIGLMMSKGISANRDNFGTKATIRSSTAPRQIVYGQTEVGGVVAHMEVTGTDNHLLHMIVLLAGHEIESLVAVKINGKKCVVGSNTTSTTIGGQTVFNVNLSDFLNTDNANKFTSSGHLIRFSFNDGSQTAADGFARNLLPSTIPTTHKYTNCAYVYMAMVFDPEKNPQIPDLKFEVKGKKCFDPRTNATAFTSNPALIIRDYLTDTTYGLKATSAEINDSTSAGGFAAAANICDQDVTLADGSSTEDRYTANGFTNMTASPEGFLQGILSSMAGKISYTNGRFNLFAGAAQTPSLTITDEDLLAPVQLATKPSSGDLYNTVKPIYVDGSNYVGTDAPVFQDSTFLAQDTPTGEASANYVKQLEIQLPFTTSSATADRLGKIALKTSRQSKIVELVTTLEFMRLQPGDWVYVTNERLSFSAKTFVVLSTNLELIEGDGDVPVAATRLALQEVESSVFTHAVSDYGTIPAESSDTSTVVRTISAPSSLSVTQVALEKFALNFAVLQVNWTNSVSELVDGTEVTYRVSGQSRYINLGVLAKGVSVVAIPQVEIGVTYEVRVRHKSIYGTFSSFVTANITTTGTVTDSTDVRNDNISIDSSNGQISGIGTGNNTAIRNESIVIDASTGEISGIGTGDNTVVRNQSITISNTGVLTGIGTGSIVVNNDTIVANNLVGSGKVFSTLPADGATVGAQFGTNLFDTDGSTNLTANQIKNGNIQVDSNGRLTNTGTGNTVFSNDQITINSSGQLAGIGTSNIVVNNQQITVDSDGDLVGIGTNDIRVNNAKIQNNTDGSLNYSGAGSGNPTMNTLTDANNIRSRVTSGLSTSGDVTRTVGKTVGGWGEDISGKTGIPDFSTGSISYRTSVPKTRGGWGEDISAKSGIPDFSSGSISYRTTVPKTRGGLEEDLSAKTGVIRVENGTFNFDAQLPASRGGTGLSSVASLQNSNVVTFEVQGGNLFVWSKFATGNFNPSATTYTFTVRWRDGSGSLLTTSSIQLNLDTTNTDFDAPTVTAGTGNSFNASTDVTGTGSTQQTISISRGSVKCTVVGRIEVVTGFTFKFED